MKERNRKWVTAGILGTVLMSGVYIGQTMIVTKAESGVQPGSVEDPLVTKSYLEEQLRKWTGQPPGTGRSSGTAAASPQPAPSTGAAPTLEVVKLEAGHILYAGAGTEIIVRTGKTIAVSNDDGIPDVTAGKDIPAGTAVENNHLLVFPREGRGIKPDPKNNADIYVMVRGSYILLKEGA